MSRLTEETTFAPFRPEIDIYVPRPGGGDATLFAAVIVLNCRRCDAMFAWPENTKINRPTFCPCCGRRNSEAP